VNSSICNTPHSEKQKGEDDEEGKTDARSMIQQRKCGSSRLVWFDHRTSSFFASLVPSLGGPRAKRVAHNNNNNNKPCRYGDDDETTTNPRSKIFCRRRYCIGTVSSSDVGASRLYASKAHRSPPHTQLKPYSRFRTPNLSVVPRL